MTTINTKGQYYYY